MKSNNKFDLYCWACDFSPNRGEGILAQHYIKELSKKLKKKFFILSPHGSYYLINGNLKTYIKNSRNINKLNLSFFENYLTPLIGISYLWVNYLRGRGVCYINFLPLWNIFLFFLLPPGTHLGPITGFLLKKKPDGINFFLRKYLNILLFKINLRILLLRQNIIYFSTDLLKPLVKSKTRKKILFNYLINLVKINKKFNQKKIDFLIYNRNYSVKNNSLRNKLLKKLTKLNITIYAVGDYLLLPGIKNLGYINRKETIRLLKKTKFIVNSGENPYNIFTIDAFNNHANIIYEKKYTHKIRYFSNKKIFFLNFSNDYAILKFYKRNNESIKKSYLKNEFKNIENDNINYFNNIKITYSKN